MALSNYEPSIGDVWWSVWKTMGTQCCLLHHMVATSGDPTSPKNHVRSTWALTIPFLMCWNCKEYSGHAKATLLCLTGSLSTGKPTHFQRKLQCHQHWPKYWTFHTRSEYCLPFPHLTRYQVIPQQCSSQVIPHGNFKYLCIPIIVGFNISYWMSRGLGALDFLG